MKEKLVISEGLTIEAAYRYYFPNSTEIEISFFFWEQTPYPFSMNKALDYLYDHYKSGGFDEKIRTWLENLA